MTRGSAGRWRTRMGNRARSRSPPVGGHLLFGERDVESAKVVLASGRRRYVNDRGADAGRSSVGLHPEMTAIYRDRERVVPEGSPTYGRPWRPTEATRGCRAYRKA